LDIAQGEKVEGELDIFIERRERERRQVEGDRRAEEMWMESERVYFAKRQEDNRIAWCEYHRRLSALHQALADEHDAELQKLENGHEKGAP
jgi:hypothetical protein